MDREAPSIRGIVGRRKILADADKLLKMAYDYFRHIDDNPLMREELVTYQGAAKGVKVSVGRHYSITGLCVYLGVTSRYFYQAERWLRSKKELSEEDQDLLDAYDHIKDVIQDQQISGAVTRIFDSNIVAKMNGITDRLDVTSGNKPMVNIIVEDKETADGLNEIEDLV